MYTLVVKNGKIIDGSGREPYFADVAIEGTKIVKVASSIEDGKNVIDATGLVITPGFIDSHSHVDASILTFSDMKEKGYGGIIPFNRPPHGFSKEQFFTEEWFSMLDNCIRACHDVGLKIWMNDDYDCPPGDIGGRLQKIAPHLKPLRLRLKGEEVTVEEVEWGFPAYEHPESPIYFQNIVYEEYKRRYGKYFGNTIIGMFSDAESAYKESEKYYAEVMEQVEPAEDPDGDQE